MGGVLAEKDGILYSVATIEDMEEVLALLKRDFIRREPVLAAMNADFSQDGEFMGLLEKFVENSITSNYSIKASTSDSNEIVGIRLTSIVTNKGGEDTFLQFLAENSDSFGDNSRKVVAWLLYVDNDLPDLFEKYGVDSYVDFAALNVDESYSNRGIGKTLMNCSFALFEERNEGYSVFKVKTANPAIRHIYGENLGFEVIHSVPIREFVFEERRVLGHFKPEHETCDVYAKKFANPCKLT